MAHFAEIQDNIVVRILRIPDSQENRGQEYLANDLGLGGQWVQTSYNNNIRGKYAGIGDIYNQEFDIFHSPQKFPSWILNTTTGVWEPPVPKPLTGKTTWNEDLQEWILRS